MKHNGRMKKFGSRLKEMRELAGMTQADLAEDSGLSPMAISHFERGRRLPSLKNFAAIMNSLGDCAAYLLGVER